MNNMEAKETVTSDGGSTDATPDAVKPDTTTNPTDTDATTPEAHDDTQQDNPSAAKASREAMKYRQALRAKTEEYDQLKQRYNTIRRRLVGDALGDFLLDSARHDAVALLTEDELDAMFNEHGEVEWFPRHQFELRIAKEKRYMINPDHKTEPPIHRDDWYPPYKPANNNGGLRGALKAARH